MDLELILQTIKNFARKLAYFIFGILIIWPVFHIIIVHNFRISSWRLFGWGMYATPNPDSQQRLRVVIPDKNNVNVADKDRVYEIFRKLSFKHTKESQCINLFIEEFEQGLRKLPRNGLCQNNLLAKDLDYFMQFGSFRHFNRFIKEALSRVDERHSETFAFLTHQRFNIFLRRAYLESDVYKISGDKVQFLGKLDHEGGVRER